MGKIYTVWVDYGSEGWQPNDFETEQECFDYILSGDSVGSKMRITEQREIALIRNGIYGE